MGVLKKLLAAALVLGSIAATSASPARAEVIVRTGDYRLVQTDVGDNGSEGPQVTRYYHSVWKEEGMFGPGWLTEYDLTVERGENDTLLLLDPCSGEKARFARAPEGTGPAAGDGAQGTVYRGSRCGCQEIVATSTGYLRSYCNRKETFDLAGRLVKVQHGPAYWVEVLRNPAGQVVALADSRGFRFDFALEGGRVARITRAGSILVHYDYDSGRLAGVSCGEDTQLRFDYDRAGLLARIGSGAGEETVSYLTDGPGPRVLRYSNEYGEWTQYGYHDEAPDGLTHATSVTFGFSEQEEGETVLHLFAEKRDEAGELWLSRETVVKGGEMMHESLFSRTGQVLESTRYGETTRTLYDSEDRIIRREGPGETAEYAYDTRNGKVNLARRSSGGTVVLETSYGYDARGNLVLLQDSTGKKISLHYNQLDQIETMDDGTRVLHFRYGSAGKPTYLEIVGIGSVEVRYDDAGQVQEVQSSKGRKVALQITRAFQELLSMTAEAKAE